jgi:hypothetical protein
MANVPTPEYQKLWSNLIESLRLEYENAIQQNPDADAVIERVPGGTHRHCPPSGMYPLRQSDRKSKTLLGPGGISTSF